MNTSKFLVSVLTIGVLTAFVAARLGYFGEVKIHLVYTPIRSVERPPVCVVNHILFDSAMFTTATHRNGWGTWQTIKTHVSSIKPIVVIENAGGVFRRSSPCLM